MNFLLSVSMLATILAILTMIAFVLRPKDMSEKEFREKFFGPAKKRFDQDIRSSVSALTKVLLTIIAYPAACFFYPAINFLHLSTEIFVSIVVTAGMFLVGHTIHHAQAK